MFCTYVRYKGLGWIMGWFLVGINQNPTWGGYASDFAYNGNCKMLLIKMAGPLPSSFYFLPKKAEVIEFVNLPKRKQ